MNSVTDDVLAHSGKVRTPRMKPKNEISKALTPVVHPLPPAPNSFPQYTQTNAKNDVH